MEERTYEMIIDDVEFGFEEYMGEFDFTVIEAVAKTIEDNHAIFRKGAFIKYAYLVQLGLGSISRGEVPDYVYEKLAEADSAIAELEDQEIEQLKKILSCIREKSRQKIIQ